MYRDDEKKEIVKRLDELFNADPCNGEYNGKKYPFVLKNPRLNLWDAIRDDALKYFEDNKIKWHLGKNNLPNGHLLSSQVACVNHLFILRNNMELATLILKNIDSDIVEAQKMESGYVEFEFIGSHPIEKGSTRGAYCTSIDACMIGKNKEGKNILFFIEWKYTEYYDKKGIKQCDTRKNVYNNRITDVNSPFKDKRPEIYYYEPFYQLMRQTLLAEECIKYNEYNCTYYKIIHVIPKENKELLETITSNKMTGTNISEAWENVLERPESYICLSPKEFLSPLFKVVKTEQLIHYLEKRYWD